MLVQKLVLVLVAAAQSRADDELLVIHHLRSQLGAALGTRRHHFFCHGAEMGNLAGLIGHIMYLERKFHT